MAGYSLVKPIILRQIIRSLATDGRTKTVLEGVGTDDKSENFLLGVAHLARVTLAEEFQGKAIKRNLCERV